MPSEPGPSSSQAKGELRLGDQACEVDSGDVAFVDAQFAFVGTVVSISGAIEPWDVDLENPERPKIPELTPWVGFVVDGWYTNDWGEIFNVWMPQHAVEVGQRLAVGGDARQVEIEGFSGQSGEVEVCSSAGDGESLPSWDRFFSQTVVPGVGVPEGDANPETLASIDAAEAAWNALELDSYSYFSSVYDRGVTQIGCNASPARIVVIDGELVEVVSMRSGPRASPGCVIEPARVPSIEELFDRARSLAGATSFSFSSHLDNGIVLNFYASDRAVEVQIAATGLSESTEAVVVGWGDVSTATSNARALWSSQSFDYQVDIADSEGERNYFNIKTTVVGGEVVEVRSSDTVIDPTSLRQPWTPFTVAGVFDLIDSFEGQGNVVAVFDAETGAPRYVLFDPIANAIDDELAKTVTITQL